MPNTCKFCIKKPIINDLCKSHFISYFEKKVYDCIDKYELILPNSKILVGVSGGKDSLTVLHLLHKKYLNVTAYIVDEGIQGYRDKTILDAEKFCKDRNIQLIKESIKDNFGITLDETIPKIKQNPCGVCGVFRRYLLNKHREYDLLATGHNMDDEIQSLFMNLAKNRIELLVRLGPKPGIISSEKFLHRIKPLYFCTEKEVMAYAYIMGFKTTFIECPYAKNSFRAIVRDEINTYESKMKGTKENIIHNFMKILPKIQKFYIESSGSKINNVPTCIHCGEPSALEICYACSLKKELHPLVLIQ